MKRLDIYLGLAAWLVALLPPYQGFFHLPYWTMDMYWQVPLLWLCLVIATVVFKQRRLRRLWWVWPSAPFALIFWISIIIVEPAAPLR